MAVLQIVEYTDEMRDEMVHRIPEGGSGEFRLGTQVVVREYQRAVFFRDGHALDVFGPAGTPSPRPTSPCWTSSWGTSLAARRSAPRSIS